MKRRYDINAARKHNEGVALVLVLVFIVLLTVLVVEFLYESEVEASFAVNQGSDFEAYLAAKSAVHDGIAQLKEQLVNLQNSEQLGTGLEEVYAGFQYDSLLDSWAVGRPFEPMNDATMRTSISDEYGKLNLNALLVPVEGSEPVVNEPMKAALISFFAARLQVDDETGPEALVDAILDWVDYGDDDNENPEGAENDYYLGLENPYPCKNGPMDSIEELLLIKGFTPEFYFGDPELEPPQFPLSEYLTVHGDWAGAVNVNTATFEVLLALEEGWQQAGNGIEVAFNAANDIVETRETLAPFVNPGDLSQYVNTVQNNDPNNPNNGQNGQNPEQDPNQNPNNNLENQQNNADARRRIFIIHGNCFRIYGDGQMDDIMVRVEAYVWRRPMDEGVEGMRPPESQGGGQTQVDVPEEDFRILDWKVIR